MGAPTSPVVALSRGNSLIAVAAGETTERTPLPCEVEGNEDGSCKGSARMQPEERRQSPTCCS